MTSKSYGPSSTSGTHTRMEGENLFHKVVYDFHEHTVAQPHPILYIHSYRFKRVTAGGWGDGSAVKSTDCSSEGPEFKFQQPTICNEIGCPLLVCLKTATVYLHIINK